MLLAINLGNSSIRFGIFEGTNCLHQWILNTHPHKSADEYAALFNSLLKERGWTLDSIKAIAIASVVPQLSDVFQNFSEQHLHLEPLFINYKLNTGISFYREKPSELGADLLVNAAYAFHKYQQACIVVDFGTALTLTVVTGEGKLTGVVICPGINTSLGALVGKTAQLPSIELKAPPSVIGKNTVECIQSGMVYGFLGMVESLIDRINSEMNMDAKVIATGGLGGVYAPLSNKIDELNPLHTIQGIQLIYSLNSSN